MQQPEPGVPIDPGREPAEGPPAMELPGADRDDPDGDLPQRLGRRIAEGANSGMASGEPDLVPDVEVPEETM